MESKSVNYSKACHLFCGLSLELYEAGARLDFEHCKLETLIGGEPTVVFPLIDTKGNPFQIRTEGIKVQQVKVSES